MGRYLGELLRRAPDLLPSDVEIVAAIRPDHAARLAAVAPRVRAIPVGARGYSLAEHRELPRAFARAGCDLVHVPHYVLPIGLRSPAVVTVHDLIHVRVPRTPLHALYARAMLGVVRRHARIVLAPSAAVARVLTDIAGIAPDRVRVVPNGVADAFLATGPAPASEVAAFVARRALPTPYVLNVTNGLPHKGLDVLLRSLRAIPGLGLAIAGAGSGRASVRRALARSGLPAVVELGELGDEELRLAYAGSAAVVVPSRDEGFGLPALEAMAVGAPVVVSDAGALPEVVGDAAVVVPAGSVACLTGALYRMAFEIQPTEREGLIQRGLTRARQFPWDRSARATCAALEQALRGPA
ncbi:MAG TPA: glycosyltransferase family 1 protein [Candidatus Binatia bacterium]|nr:glycosyltransferase family 1 protein [Candidatus Binatia bacterium]